MVVLHHRQIRVIDAGEGLKAFGACLAGTGAQNDLAVKDDLHAAAAPAGVEKRIGQIPLGVGAVEPDGLLRSGQHDGLGAALHQIAEGRRRIGHGVGAVTDHEAVVLLVVVPDGLRHPQPMLGLKIGAVQTVYLNAVHMAQFTDPGHKGQ